MGNEVVQKQPEIAQNEYQKSLDAGISPPPLTSETVRYWSDFNRVFYHPRSIVQLSEYELNSTLSPFEDWRVGEDLFQDLDKEHDLLDRDVRPFAEESDQLRAFQLFTGSDDAWGGFAARYVDRLRDEYGKTGIWVWALEDGARLQRVGGVIIYRGVYTRLRRHSTRKCSRLPILQERSMRYRLSRQSIVPSSILPKMYQIICPSILVPNGTPLL